MPFLLVLFLVAFLDRTNVSVAALDMKKDLGFDDAIIGSGAGIFFLGYFLLEIPGTILVERWSARKWIARIMISWGVIACLMGFIGLPLLGSSKPQSQFYWLRFILGLAEAGFFPGVIVFLGHWFRYEDRAKAKAWFLIGIPLATIIAVPVSQWIMHAVHWAGLAGWRWVYILEGIPALGFGIWTIFYLTDRPEQAKWLADDEREWIVGEIAREHQEKSDFGGAAIMAGLLNPQILLMAAIYLFAVTGMYGLTFFLPSITSAMKGTSVVSQTLITMLPYFLGFGSILYNGWHSDRTGERRWHTSIPLLLGALSMAGCALFASNLALSVLCLSSVGLALYAYLPAFWTQPGSRLTASSSAVAIGLINSIGNLGGYFGPKFVGEFKVRSGSYASGLWFLTICLLVAGILAMLLRPVEKKTNSLSARS